MEALMREAAPAGWDSEWAQSTRREDAAKAIYRYATRMSGETLLRWSDVEPAVRERMRQAADLALAVADETQQPVLAYVGLAEWLRQMGERIDSPARDTDPGRRWALAGMFRSAVAAMRRAAAGLTPELVVEARTLHARDTEAMRDGERRPALTNRSLTPRGEWRELRDLDGNRVEG